MRRFSAKIADPSISRNPRHYWVSAVCDAVVLVHCHSCSDVLRADLLLRGMAVGGGGGEAVPGDVDGGGSRGARSDDLARQSSRAPTGTRAGAAAGGCV